METSWKLFSLTFLSSIFSQPASSPSPGMPQFSPLFVVSTSPNLGSLSTLRVFSPLTPPPPSLTIRAPTSGYKSTKNCLLSTHLLYVPLTPPSSTFLPLPSSPSPSTLSI
ncbi:hypothetical protein DITRI_Ditri12bG0063400 [Diplodiscus trichospermus]